LPVAGGKRNDDDGVRETYIGNVEAVGNDIFPDTFDYVALGHYHIPSVIKDHIRYCGSPIPMGFGEAGQKKLVYLIDFNEKRSIEPVEIPAFQQLESIVGDKNFIAQRLSELKKNGSSVWVEVIYTGDDIFPDLSSWVNEQIADSNIEVLKLQNRQYLNEVLTQADAADSLDELNEMEVFDKLLEKNNISDDQKAELKALYQEIIDSLQLQEEAL
jgi:exonuclease SbcD